MRIIILLIIFFLIAINVNSKGSVDDIIYDPTPNITPIKIPPKDKTKATPLPVDSTSGKLEKPLPVDYTNGQLRELPILSLTRYIVKRWDNSESTWFCKRIVDQIDNIEKREDKIISVSITGFADGLKNRGVAVPKESLYIECRKHVNPSGLVLDPQLAQLRACQIKEQLKDLLKNRSYFVFVQPEEYFDYKDGESSGENFRKVDVEIKYLDKNNN